jgi:hypothetical protein
MVETSPVPFVAVTEREVFSPTSNIPRVDAGVLMIGSAETTTVTVAFALAPFESFVHTWTT